MVPLQGGWTWRDWGVATFYNFRETLVQSPVLGPAHCCAQALHLDTLAYVSFAQQSDDLFPWIYIWVSLCLYLPAASTNCSLNPVVFNHKAAFLFSCTFLYGNAYSKCLTSLTQVPGHLGPGGDWSLYLEWCFCHWKWGFPAELDQNFW